jgi:hypothetical protein
MSKNSIQMLTTDSSGTAISLPYSHAGGNLTSSNVPADSYYGHSDGLHTVSITLSGFTGSIALEGTLATTPGANDWFRIPLGGVNAISFTTTSGTTAYTFTGNYVYIKALVFSASAGSVSSILLNH